LHQAGRRVEQIRDPMKHARVGATSQSSLGVPEPRDSDTNGRGILNFVKRLSILIVALIIGAAAPARAWCEATCLEPVTHSESTRPHCPSHESPSGGTSLSAAGITDCPSIESARPVPAKLDFAVAAIDIAPHARAPRQLRTHAPRHVRTTARLHLADTPLRL